VAGDLRDEICGHFRNALAMLYPARSFVAGDASGQGPYVALEILSAGVAGMELRLTWESPETGRHVGDTKGIMISDRSLSPQAARKFVMGVVSEAALPF
jgi:hypothetical protein